MFDRNKKDSSSGAQDAADSTSVRPDAGAAQPRPAARAASREAAVIGPSIHIDGDVRGEEDLIIKGKVNGTVRLAKNSVTVGVEGSIKADVHAQVISVEGTVKGDLYASERVGIRKGATVAGNIMAPSVSLDEGAKFKGSIEMDVEVVETSVGGRPAGAKPAATRPNGDGHPAKPKDPAAKTTSPAS